MCVAGLMLGLMVDLAMPAAVTIFSLYGKQILPNNSTQPISDRNHTQADSKIYY